MSFIAEKPIKSTRKRHICAGCDKWIEIGESAVNWCGINDGGFNSVNYHPECRQAEVQYNNEVIDAVWDEWTCLHDADSEDWPWIKDNHPLVYQRMIMTREQWAARS